MSLALPWCDRAGRVSMLKATVFLALLAPGVVNAVQYAVGTLGARPLNAFIHAMGLWTIRLLLVSLAVTPLRQISHSPALVPVRRMIGVAAFAYGAIHLGLYAADQSFAFGTIATEIARRVYLAIGFAALLALAALAATSTDGMLRRLGGRRWQPLHRLAYPAAAAGILHYILQSKLELWEPTLVAGLFLWLMGYRAIVWRAGIDRARSVAAVAVLGIAASLATALGEAAYFRLHFGADMLRVLAADLSWSVGIRPAWIVLATGLSVAAIALAQAARATVPAPRLRGFDAARQSRS